MQRENNRSAMKRFRLCPRVTQASRLWTGMLWRPRRLRVIAGFAIAIGAAALWFLYRAPLPVALFAPDALTTRYLDVKGRLIAELPGPEARSHRPIPLAEMGPWVPAFTVALEDRRFFTHCGVDFLATGRALLRGHGGGSTITQQLVKIETARKGRSLWAKTCEMALALQLERRWSKAQILEAYLNRIPYGNRLIGVEAAAQAYFGKPAEILTQAEAIYLVGLPQAPARFNPWSHPEAAARQFERSEKLQAPLLPASSSLSPVSDPEWTNTDGTRTGNPASISLPLLSASPRLPVPASSSLPLLSASPRPRVSASSPVPLIERHLPLNRAPHFLQALRASQPTQRPAPDGIVQCTLDLDLQQQAQQAVVEHLNELHRPDITQAALVIIENQTGAVRALVGSRDFGAGTGGGEVNGALAWRNCGSTLKPFLYLTGIDRKVFTAATLLPDTADAVRGIYPDYDPHNFVHSHLGPVRVREALGNSLNVPAVMALSRVGARSAFDAIAGWGLTFDHPIEEVGAGFILGNVGVRLLDLTSAFSGLARGGLAGPPALFDAPPTVWRRMASPGAVEIITDILCDNAARFHSFGANSPLATPVRVGAKTGTSAEFRDAWAVGFTLEHTVGVWVGNFDGRPMSHTASVIAAAPLWRRVIDRLLEQDHPVPEPKLPRRPVCSLTGLLPCPRSPGTIGELFFPGTEPTETAEGWFAPDGHPVLPMEYAGWCASGHNRWQATVRPHFAQLAILSPRDKAVFLMDENLPVSQQQVEFRINIPEGATWKLNGKPLSAPNNGRLLWQIQPGEWSLEVSNQAAQVTSKFVVEGK